MTVQENSIVKDLNEKSILVSREFEASARRRMESLYRTSTVGSVVGTLALAR